MRLIYNMLVKQVVFPASVFQCHGYLYVEVILKVPTPVLMYFNLNVLELFIYVCLQR